jgi:esterase/lipase superfamily enzyme
LDLVGIQKIFIRRLKDNAKKNGQDLAQFVVDFDKRCPNTRIHLTAHSLGSAVVESMLNALDNNSTMKTQNSERPF